MKRWLSIIGFVAIAVLPLSHPAQAQRAQYQELVARHAKANLVPEALVHRVIVRESGYRAELLGRGGTIGLMQIKLATARGLGYSGDAEGLRDPDTNLTYAVKYLAGAYRAAKGDHDRAVHYYASGYYEVAKQQRRERRDEKPAGPLLANAPSAEGAKPEEVVAPAESAKPVEAVATANDDAKPKEATAPSKDIAPPKAATTKPKAARKKLAEAREGTKEPVPRPPASIPGGANTARPR